MKELELEYRMFGTGKSTLIIEVGIGGDLYNWISFINQIQKDFRVVIYHRAGYGKSTVSQKTRTTKNIATELNELVERLGITDKFVLMGHSFGGLCAQQYAKLYPEKIKGIILIDSTSFNFSKLYKLNIPVMNSLISIEKMVENNLNTSKNSKESLEIKFKDLIMEYEMILPSSESKQFKDFILSPLLFETTAKEFENWESSSRNIIELGKFPDIPLTVIARDKNASIRAFIKHGIPSEEAILYEDVWRKLQIELSQMSSYGEMVIAENSDHDIQMDRPDIILQCLMRYIN